MPRGPRIARAALLSLLLLAPARTRAGTEQFSTFDVEAMEQDDESVIDHIEARFPREWRDAWEHSPRGLRSSEGCLSSAVWMSDTEVRTEAPMGQRALFDFDFHQSESDVANWDFLDFWFRFPQRAGTASVMFRPFRDKSRQDFALRWETGADTTALQVQATWGLEDLFNNFWAFRQTQVGQTSERYTRHPWEPALRIVSRHDHGRAEIDGQYLTPSSKRLQPLVAGGAMRTGTLWGTRLDASAETQAFGAICALRVATQQALSTDRPDSSTAGAHLFRRLWSAEATVSARPCPRLAADAGYYYVARTQVYGPPAGPARFDAVDRVLQLEGRWSLRPRFALRLGGLYDRVTIAKQGVTPWTTEGTRDEGRLYYGFDARFGRVRVRAAEGTHVDHEPYPTTFRHAHAFVQLQTTF